MIRTLTVFYLHKPGRFDAKRLPVIEYGLTDAFRDFCRETFDARGALDYPPMKLVTVHDAPTLAKALFTSGGPRGVLTELGRACCLFLIDDDLMKLEVEGLSLRSWLKLFFPAIPKVVLTRPGPLCSNSPRATTSASCTSSRASGCRASPRRSSST